MTAIEFRNVVKTYPEFCLGPINMTVQQGEFFGIFGPPVLGQDLDPEAHSRASSAR